MTSFTGTSQVLVVEVDEGLPALAAELTRRGVASRQDGRVLLVRLEGDATYDAIRDAIAGLGLPLNRLEQARRRVEELFRDDEAPQVRHDR
jgi:ABC-2 type transport system ATP-binding protein